MTGFFSNLKHTLHEVAAKSTGTTGKLLAIALPITPRDENGEPIEKPAVSEVIFQPNDLLLKTATIPGAAITFSLFALYTAGKAASNFAAAVVTIDHHSTPQYNEAMGYMVDAGVNAGLSALFAISVIASLAINTGDLIGSGYNSLFSEEVETEDDENDIDSSNSLKASA